MTIDIMLPYYGDVAMMKRAVQSVLSQDDPDFRLTIVDDASPDPSLPDYFRGLTERDPRVVYHRNATNLGANANFRRCAAMIEHPITVFMGSDDIMLPHYVSTVRRLFACDDVAMVQPGVQVIDETETVHEPFADRTKRWLRHRAVGRSSTGVLVGEAAAGSLMHGNWLYFPSIAWRSDKLPEHPFNEQYDVVQDLALAMDVIMEGGALLVSDEMVFQYRRHRQSDSSVRALDGRRFSEERAFYHSSAADFRHLGWTRAERAARLHATSRLHAGTLLPRVVKQAHWHAAAAMVAHAVRF